jgi:hypothetical protein
MQTKEGEQKDMADIIKIDRKTRQAVRKKNGEIWQTERKRAERCGRQKKDRQTDTAGCQKERRRDLADRKEESREI